jgi:hypothetical protein
MKREDLKNIGLSDEHIEEVMKLRGKSETDDKKAESEIATLTLKVKEQAKQLDEANKTIEGFKQMDIDGVKKSAEEWQTKYESADKEYKAKIDDLSKRNAVTSVSAGLKFSSKGAKAAFEKDLYNAGLKLDGDTFLGADDYVKKYTENDPTSFDKGDGGATVTTGAGHEGTKPETQSVNERFLSLMKPK